jgi:hypothetical protein
MLRFLAGVGFVAQDDSLEFTHTKFSLGYLEEPGPGNFFSFGYDTGFMTAITYPEYFQTKRFEPNDSCYNPYTARHNQDGTNFVDIIFQSPQRLKQFQAGMAFEDSKISVTGFYDFGSLAGANDGDRMTLVDVGGGHGQALVDICRAFPSLNPKKMVLQDLGPVVERARSTNGSIGFDIVEYDFWNPQFIKGAKAYYLRRVLHGYSDANCVRILSNTREAMEADSKLLIAEMLVPERLDGTTVNAATTDMAIMSYGGKERTLKQFKTILASAKLQYVAIWQPHEGWMNSLVEARKA